MPGTKIGWNIGMRDSLIGMIQGETLGVRLELTVNAEIFHYIPPNPHQNTALKLLEDGERCGDVIFEVHAQGSGGLKNGNLNKTAGEIRAHSCIMMKCQSRKLGDMVTSAKVVGGVKRIMITDVGRVVFHLMLFHIYGGEMSGRLFTTYSKDVLKAASNYGLVNLKMEAEAAFVRATTVTSDNFEEMKLLAKNMKCPLIEECTADYRNLIDQNTSGGSLRAHNRELSLNKQYEGGQYNHLRVSALRQLLHEKGMQVDMTRENMIKELDAEAMVDLE